MPQMAWRQEAPFSEKGSCSHTDHTQGNLSIRLRGYRQSQDRCYRSERYTQVPLAPHEGL